MAEKLLLHGEVGYGEERCGPQNMHLGDYVKPETRTAIIDAYEKFLALVQKALEDEYMPGMDVKLFYIDKIDYGE